MNYLLREHVRLIRKIARLVDASAGTVMRFKKRILIINYL